MDLKKAFIKKHLLFLAFKEKNISFIEQVKYQVKFKEQVLEKRSFDFVVESMIVVEIKRDTKFSQANIDQTIDYLKTSNLKLAILINFGKEGVIYKRLINP